MLCHHMLKKTTTPIDQWIEQLCNGYGEMGRVTQSDTSVSLHPGYIFNPQTKSQGEHTSQSYSHPLIGLPIINRGIITLEILRPVSCLNFMSHIYSHHLHLLRDGENKSKQ